MKARFSFFFWLALALGLTCGKLWLVAAQPIYAISMAVHDDRLFLELAEHLTRGDWFGPYSVLTLAKGPFFPLWIAAMHQMHVPLPLSQHLAYSFACAMVVLAFAPRLRSGAASFCFYALLLWNPLTFEGTSLSRVLRQSIGAPLVLLIFAALIALYLRRRTSFARQAPWAGLLGLSFAAFWLTREEGSWILPGVGLLSAAWLWGLRDQIKINWPRALAPAALIVTCAVLPLLIVSILNYKHYGWFGTVEFRAAAFKDAYGALVRVEIGPDLPQVPVTRQAREAIYAVSPAFAELQPWLEGPIGDQWSEKELFPAEERQMRGGWFIWALRDSVAAAGHGNSAQEALQFYRRMADEINRACDEGLLPAGRKRSGFLPRLDLVGLWPQLKDASLVFARYFFLYDNFSARVSPSLGDHAWLTLFKDMTGARLSPTPVAPLITPPDQEAPYTHRLARLQQIGEWLIILTRPLVLLAHAVFFIRLLESGSRRRLSHALIAACAAWLCCLAYLAINVLVHVTSFANLTPAALAMAYPLLLLFIGAVTVDAAAAWWHRAAGATEDVFARNLSLPAATAGEAKPDRLAWLWPFGVAGIVFALRLHEVFRHGGDVPFNDQWVIEASDIIGPWLDGGLRPWAFFAPHHEHIPVWTRLMAWIQVALTGRWDPLVQMTVNAALHAAGVFLIVNWAKRVLPFGASLLIGLLVIALGGVPHAWENIAWGFQSQFPLALLCLFINIHGSFAAPPGSRTWWIAQAAGIAGFFTLGSMWVAPLAVALISLWTHSGGNSRLRWIPPALALSGMGIMALIYFTAAPGYAFAHNASSPLLFLRAWLNLLGWPLDHPAAPVILNLPLLGLFLRLRGQSATPAFDRLILALGLWAVAQAAGTAFARGGDYTGFVSRHGDVLAILPLANGLALCRLLPAIHSWQPVFRLFICLWVGMVGLGLHTLATTGHARHFHEHSAHWSGLRREAVQQFIHHDNDTPLTSEPTATLLFFQSDRVAGLLSRPTFQALLPASVNPDNPPDLAGKCARMLQRQWAWLLGLSLLPLLTGLWRGRHATGSLPPLPSTRCARVDGFILAGITGGGLIVLGLLSPPFEFRQEQRWRNIIAPPDAVENMTFAFAGDAPLFPPERLVGAARLDPPALRNLFFGTHPEGPEQTGTVLGSPFRITHRWFIVPHAGYPVSHGNGLRIRIENAAGQTIAHEVGCPGPNPGHIGFWAADLGEYAGHYGRVVLYDGRTETDAWVAVAPPIASDSPELAAQLAHRLDLEQLIEPQITVTLIVLVCGLWTGGLFVPRLLRRYHPAPAPARP